MRAKGSRSPKETIGMTNNDIFPDLERQTFVTCFYGVLDMQGNNVDFVRAGHTLTLAYRAATKDVEVLRSNGMALGMTTGPMFADTVGDLSVVLGEGDMLLQYTDGVIEAVNSREEEFGMQRLVDGFKKFGKYDAEYTVDKLASTVKSYIGEAEQTDDITILCVKRTGVDLEARKRKMLQ
jgi:sigma-B regulation protein RsbU (phosphoserine phosphatase)